MRESVPPREAAALASCSVPTLQQAVQRGELHQYRERGCRVFHTGEVIAWAKARGLIRT